MTIELCVHGYHIYYGIWEVAVREELPCDESPGTQGQVCCSCTILHVKYSYFIHEFCKNLTNVKASTITVAWVATVMHLGSGY